MPIKTNLTVSPYFDDYDESKDYYRILFRPGNAVQVRELNQLQTILQNQIEKFGDHVLQRGTILDGCQPTFINALPYVKLRDTTADSAALSMSDYKGLRVRNSANLIAEIVETRTGFESQDPDLNTFYLNYLNSGNDFESDAYTSGSVLTIYNKDNRLYRVGVDVASQGFSNSDSVVFLSAIEVQNTSGGTDYANGIFSVGETITQPDTGATAVITAVNTSANTTATVLSIRPLSDQLAIANTDSWSFGLDYQIEGGTTGNEAVLRGFVGSGATATFNTTAAGAIERVDIVNGGSGYYINPHTTMSTLTASEAQINTLTLSAKNFTANVTIASSDDFTAPVGVGYGLEITEGHIYQMGQFLRVDPQFIIVDKYANTPSDVAVGFSTQERVVNSAVDSTLFDNAAGFLNENAPGANRLKLTPQLIVYSDEQAEADDNFLSIFKFNQGRVYNQLITTQYNKINDELAQRTYEQSGNFVLDPFQVSTKSPVSIANSDTHFEYVVDPGHAYINGYRIKTERNFTISVEKSTLTETFADSSYDVVYGNYVRVDEFAGIHNFKAGAQVSLMDAQTNYIRTDVATAITTAVQGTEIGKARIRSVVYESGEPGTPSAVYRLYLFDIKMNAGKDFKRVRSVYSSVGNGGIGDIILEREAGSGGGLDAGRLVAKIQEKTKNTLIMPISAATKSVSNISYSYRTIKTSADGLSANTLGQFDITASSGAEWPYTGALTSSEEQQLIIIPEEDIVNSSGIGTLSSAANGQLTATSSSFVTDLVAGDYIYVGTSIARVTKILSDTGLEYSPLDALDSATGTIYQVLPANVPVPFSSRTNRTMTVSGTTLTVNLGITPASSKNITAIYNQKITSATPVTKTVHRKAYIKVQANTHPESVDGPWCVGFGDVFRLRGVYAGATTSDTNITKEFYIDHNQNENYYDLGYLYKKPGSTYTIGADDVLLVEFDLFTHGTPGEGLKVVNSYNINDELSLAGLDASGTTVNTMEIPEVMSKTNVYYDLRDCLDFRPLSANTVAIVTTPASAPVNPAEPTESTRFDSDDKLFPVPESDLFFSYEVYKSRADDIILNSDGNFEVLQGRTRNYEADPDQIILYNARIPPYPSLPENLSPEMVEITDKKIANESYLEQRLDKYRIRTQAVAKQIPRYTMADISKLERRIVALEHYMKLSDAEQKVKEETIPSSIDPSIERFKFGFFIDDFSTPERIDQYSPEQNAIVYDGRLFPARFSKNIKMKSAGAGFDDGLNISQRYTSAPLINQTVATDGPVEYEIVEQVETIATITEVPTPAFRTGRLNANMALNSNDTDSVGTIITLYHSTNFTARNDEITLYYNCFSAPDRIEIYKDLPYAVWGSGASNYGASFVQWIQNGVKVGSQTITPVGIGRRAVFTATERARLRRAGASSNLWAESGANVGTPEYFATTGDTAYWHSYRGKVTLNVSNLLSGTGNPYGQFHIVIRGGPDPFNRGGNTSAEYALFWTRDEAQRSTRTVTRYIKVPVSSSKIAATATQATNPTSSVSNDKGVPYCGSGNFSLESWRIFGGRDTSVPPPPCELINYSGGWRSAVFKDLGYYKADQIKKYPFDINRNIIYKSVTFAGTEAIEIYKDWVKTFT